MSERLSPSYSGSGQYYQPYVRLYAWSSDGHASPHILLGDGLYVARADGVPKPTSPGVAGRERGATVVVAGRVDDAAYEADGAVPGRPPAGREVSRPRLATEGSRSRLVAGRTTVALRHAGRDLRRSPGREQTSRRSVTGTKPRLVADRPATGSCTSRRRSGNTAGGFTGGSSGSSAPTARTSIVDRRIPGCCAGIVDGTLTWSDGGQARRVPGIAERNGRPLADLSQPDGSGWMAIDRGSSRTSGSRGRCRGVRCLVYHAGYA